MTEDKIRRVHAAHVELANALNELRKDTTHPKVVRALSTSITNAESAYLWFRSAVNDYDCEGNAHREPG